MAEYEKAEAVFRISLALRQQIHGTKHTEYMADYKQAEPVCNASTSDLKPCSLGTAHRVQCMLDQTASLHDLG